MGKCSRKTYSFDFNSLDGFDLGLDIVGGGLEGLEGLLKLINDSLVLQDLAIVGKVNSGFLLLEIGKNATSLFITLTERAEGSNGLSLKTKGSGQFGPVNVGGSSLDSRHNGDDGGRVGRLMRKELNAALTIKRNCANDRSSQVLHPLDELAALTRLSIFKPHFRPAGLRLASSKEKADHYPVLAIILTHLHRCSLCLESLDASCVAPLGNNSLPSVDATTIRVMSHYSGGNVMKEEQSLAADLTIIFHQFLLTTGTGGGAMGRHTKRGGYFIEWEKVRSFVVPDLTDFKVLSE